MYNNLVEVIMSNTSILIKFFLFILFFFTQNLLAQNQINFLRVNFPPLWITEGPLKSEGIADAGENFIKNTMPHFSYKNIDVTVARAQSFMSGQSEKTYCAVPHGKGFFKNVIESEVWVAISGHVLTSTKKFITDLKSNKTVLNGHEQLILTKFLNTSQKRGLVTKGQKYPILDPILEPYRTNQIKNLVSTDMLSLYNMVLKQRADYTFQYESTVKYLQKLNYDMKFITLEELNNHKVLIVVGCNDTPLAQKFISELNKSIEGLRGIGLQKMKEYHSPITFENIKNFIPKK